MERNVYLSAIELNTIDSILKRMLKDINYKTKTEIIKVKDSLNRTTSKSVFSKTSSPSYSASAMDGVCVKALDTYQATETNPVTLNDFQYINTGNVLPDDYDTVVMIEDIHENEDNSITIYRSFRMYENVRPIGEDITKGDLVIPLNHKIRPIDISALISAGIEEIEVINHIKIAVIPTGDEIVSDLKDMKKGKIADSNSYFISNELELLDINCDILDVQIDDFDTLQNTMFDASLKYDLLLIGAGSSAGSKDFVKSIIEKNGSVYAHGINMKPGKPTVIGQLNNTPVIGLPGYPVSTYIAFNNVVKPLLGLMINIKYPKPIIKKAVLAQKVYSSLKNHEFVRVSLAVINDKLVAIPLSRKAGVTMSVVKADGLIHIPKNSEGYLAGEEVDVNIINNRDYDNAIVVIGSHDILFDFLSDELMESETNLISVHVGSMGGVMAINRDECHIAPVHILHEDGTYNEHIIEKYLNDDYMIIKGIKRTQGIYVKKGNPKNITTLKDIANHSFVNRQRGSGTRLLLDYLLKQENINPNDIEGYNLEITTHIGIAESVKDDRFDCGIGIQSVAKYADIDFIPIGDESYDFIVRKDFIHTEQYRKFIKAFNSKSFQDKFKELGGYKFD